MTWADTAKEAVRQHGDLYFSDVLDRLTTQLSSVAFPAVAVVCAERLLSRHLQLPSSSQRPFAVTCRRPLDCMWDVLAGQPDATALRGEVERWLQSYYDSPLNHSDGQDGPDDADHDPAAAVIYAAESLVRDSAESAGYAMSRVVDSAFTLAEDERETHTPAIGRVDDFVADCCHPTVQHELRWVESVFAFIRSHPLSHETITDLRNRANA